ncbi:MAG: YcfL family protein [Kiritimatiellia bacterium]
MKSMLMAVAFLFTLATFFCGCAATAKDPRITLGQGAGAICVEKVRTMRVGESLKIQLSLLNRTTVQQCMAYRVTWLDAGGMAVGIGSPTDSWRSVSLAPQEVRFISAVAPNADCCDYRIYIKGDD